MRLWSTVVIQLHSPVFSRVGRRVRVGADQNPGCHTNPMPWLSTCVRGGRPPEPVLRPRLRPRFGIRTPCLMPCGSRTQRARFSSVFLRVPAAIYERAPTLARLGPTIPLGAFTATSEWQAMQPLAVNSFSPRHTSGLLHRSGGPGLPRSAGAGGGRAAGVGGAIATGAAGARGLHVRHPGLKIFRLLRLDSIGHPSVLDAAELGALTRVIALRLRREPHPGLPIGKHVALGCELGNPEAVNDVVAGHAKRDRPPHRDVQLISRGQVELGIAELPPPLVPHHLDGERVFARDGVGLEDGSHRGHRDGRQDQGRNDGPDDLDRSVPVGLMWLRVSGLPPEAEDGVEQNPLDQHEHEQRPLDRGVQEIVGDLGEIPPGKQRGLRIVLGTAAGQRPVRAGRARRSSGTSTGRRS